MFALLDYVTTVLCGPVKYSDHIFISGLFREIYFWISSLRVSPPNSSKSTHFKLPPTYIMHFLDIFPLGVPSFNFKFFTFEI